MFRPVKFRHQEVSCSIQALRIMLYAFLWVIPRRQKKAHNIQDTARISNYI